MDLEKLLTQSVITVFTVIFIFIMFWAKNKIEKMFRKNSDHIKQSKVRLKTVSYKESFLCKKVLRENTNRHQRSIIASSLNEELQKLQDISDSIKRVKVIPQMMPNFQHVDVSFLTDFGTSNKTYSKGENCLAGSENKKFMKDHKPLQSKLCKKWRDHAKKQLKIEGKHIDSRSYNDSMYKNRKRKIVQITKTWPQIKCSNSLIICNSNDESQQSIEIKNSNSGFLIERQKIIKNKRPQEEIVGLSLKRNLIISNSVCETKSNISLMDSSKNSSHVDFKLTPPTDERFQIKRPRYTFPSKRQHTEGISIHLDWHKKDYSNSANNAVKQLDNKLDISLNKSKSEYQFHNIKTNVSKCTFGVHLTCYDNNLIINRRIEKKSTNPGNMMKSKIQLIKHKKHKICTTCLLGKSGYSTCIFKVPIKIQKKEIIIKFIFCVILKNKPVKSNKYYQQRNMKNVKPILSLYNLGKMPTKCTIKNNNKLEHKKSLSKKHTIYTSSDKCPKRIENNEMADGDTVLPPAIKCINDPISSIIEQNEPDSWFDYTSAKRNNLEASVILQQSIDLTKAYLKKFAVKKHEGWSDFESENNLGSTYNYILHQCIELTGDCLKDSMGSFDYESLLEYETSNDKTILTTIEEESVEDIYDSNENTNGGKFENSLVESKNVSVCTDENNLTIDTDNLKNDSENDIFSSNLTSFKVNIENVNSQSSSLDESEENLQLSNYNKDLCALNYDEDKNECNEEMPQNLIKIDISTKLESIQNKLRMLGYCFEIKHLGEPNNSDTLNNDNFNSFNEISTQLVTGSYQMRQLFFRNDSSMCSISEHSWQSDILRFNNNPSTWTFQEVKVEESILEEIHSQNYLVLKEAHVCVQGSEVQFDTTFYNSSTLIMLEAKLFASADHDLVSELSSRKLKGKLKKKN